MEKFFCQECQKSLFFHYQNWLEEFFSFLPNFIFSKKLEFFLTFFLEKIFTFFKLASWQENFDFSKIHLKSTLVIEELRKRGVKIEILKGPFGFTNHFRAKIGKKIFYFDGLPVVSSNKFDLQIFNDKEKTKKLLKKYNFPVPEGKAFWFWQKKEALKYGKTLGFPLVVKPRSGSFSRHITTNIQNLEELKKAINKAISYSPAFLLEKFLSGNFVYRITIVDFEKVFCGKRVAAHVVGDGVLKISQLIEEKNIKEKRGETYQKDSSLYKIVVDETSEKLLKEKGYNLESIPPKGEIVFLQKDPFVRLGADFIEETPKIHSENIKLFQKLAKTFDIKLVGIDFLAKDISIPWKEQECAILELNNLPCIEVHHFPSLGQPQNVAKEVANLFFKYYL
jgi:cyanophycin synthetase